MPEAAPSSSRIPLWRLQGAAAVTSPSQARAFSTTAGLRAEGKSTEDKPKVSGRRAWLASLPVP